MAGCLTFEFYIIIEMKKTVCFIIAVLSMMACAASRTTEEQRSPVLNIDMEVSFQALTLDLLDSYEKLEPFGNSNPQPLFMSSDVFPTEPPKRVGTNHLKLFMRQGIVERDAIFFNGAERELPNPPWDIAFTIDRNVYRGRASLSISIQEIRSHREM